MVEELRELGDAASYFGGAWFKNWNYNGTSGAVATFEIDVIHTREGAVHPLAHLKDGGQKKAAQRFIMFLFPVSEDEEAYSEEHDEGKKAVARAGMLANDPEFVDYLLATSQVFDASPEAVADFIRDECGVQSRRELASSSDARQKLKVLTANYMAWRKWK